MLPCTSQASGPNSALQRMKEKWTTSWFQTPCVWKGPLLHVAVQQLAGQKENPSRFACSAACTCGEWSSLCRLCRCEGAQCPLLHLKKWPGLRQYTRQHVSQEILLIMHHHTEQKTQVQMVTLLLILSYFLSLCPPLCSPALVWFPALEPGMRVWRVYHISTMFSISDSPAVVEC